MLKNIIQSQNMSLWIATLLIPTLLFPLFVWVLIGDHVSMFEGRVFVGLLIGCVIIALFIQLVILMQKLTLFAMSWILERTLTHEFSRMTQATIYIVWGIGLTQIALFISGAYSETLGQQNNAILVTIASVGMALGFILAFVIESVLTKHPRVLKAILIIFGLLFAAGAVTIIVMVLNYNASL